MSSAPPLVLTFSASDPTGGAGLQADVLTLAAMGCHPLSVLTGFTVQDTSGVESLVAIDADRVAEQARRILEDMSVAAFKLGVLGSLQNIGAIARVVAEHPQLPLVLDPVLASGRGDALATEEMVQALRELIVPRATVVTPNSLEARRLGGAQQLLELGCDYVLVTGTHEPGVEIVNTLYGETGVVRQDRWRRLPWSYHGSGCTLAAAIAAAIAHGLEVADAVRDAQRYTWEALNGGFRPGKGQHLPDRFFWAREAEGEK